MRLVVEVSYYQEIPNDEISFIKEIPLNEINEKLEEYKKDLEKTLISNFESKGLKINASIVED